MTRFQGWSFLPVLFLMELILTSCSSQSTPTNTPNPYSVTGTLTYNGSLASVDVNHRLAVYLKAAPNFTLGGSDLYMQSTANGAVYSVNPSGPGTYYLVAFFGALNEACTVPTTGNFPIPRQGDPYYFYNGVVCGAAVGVTITSTQTSASVNIQFDDTCLMNGISGSVFYTGSHSVSASNGLVVAFYQDSGYTSRDSLGFEYRTCNNTTYSLVTDSPSTRYLIAFLDLAGTGAPAAGDPYIKVGAVTPSPTLVQDITFDDSTVF